MYVCVVRLDPLCIWQIQVFIVLGGYLRILSAPSIQSCCTLSTSSSYRVLVCSRYGKSRLFLCVVVGPGFVSTSPAFMRSSGSAWPACPETVNRAPIVGNGRYLHNLHITFQKPLWQLHRLYAVSFGAFFLNLYHSEVLFSIYNILKVLLAASISLESIIVSFISLLSHLSL